MKSNSTFKEIFDQCDRKFLNENRRQLEEDVDEIINELWSLKRKIHHSSKDTRYDVVYFQDVLWEVKEKCDTTRNKWFNSKYDYRDENVPIEIMDKYMRLHNGDLTPEQILIGDNEIEQCKPNQAKLFD